MKKSTRWYVGYNGQGFIAFTTTETPVQTTHGDRFMYVIGPFRTRRGAFWAERYGYRNPHFCHVRDAERLAKKLEKDIE